MMQDWTDEELKDRWNILAEEYVEKGRILAPLLQRLNNIEKELKVLSSEIVKRGLTSEKENGR